MISRLTSFVLQGIDALPCEIEVDLSPVGLPKQTIVGLPDAAVRESIERVRTAIINSGFRFPTTRMTLNLAPADVKKEGPVYDLPMAIAILMTDGAIQADFESGEHRAAEYVVAGELALDGRVRSVRGVISLALMTKKLGKRGLIIPADNAAEAAAVDGIEVRAASTLGEVVTFLNGQGDLPTVRPVDADSLIAETAAEIDFADIKGQEAAKRAVTIAAAGGHNLLMIGPAGTGKTMMAKALPGILPPLSRDEALEVTRIYSSVGKVRHGESLITHRPVRTPHHTASGPAVVGGGTVPRPGDVSLAHRGVLFLDELPEFGRHVLETLREPLEDGAITIARSQGSVRFPARFMLVAAMNPTPKGDFAKDEVGQREMERYLSRLSGPLVDRIDLHVEVPAVSFRHLSQKAKGTSSADMRQQVLRARARQTRRHGSARTNSELSGKELDRFVPLDDASRDLLSQAMRELGLSARAYDKIRRVARTIADLEDSDGVASHHVGEAVQYRLLDRMRG